MKLNKNLLLTAVTSALVLTGPLSAYAALAPGFLGAAENFSVFGAAGITGGAASTVWGDVGENGFGDGSISGQQAGTYYPAANGAVVAARTSAYGALAAETPTGSVDLSTPTSVGPGVYTVSSSAFSQTLTLTGAGTYVFQRATDIAQTAGGTMVLTGGACASNVYWQTSTGMTFAASGNIEGTIVAETAITFANSALTFKGRALTDTAVALGGITITEPVTCATPAVPSSGGDKPTPPEQPLLTVFKHVINDNGGTAIASDSSIAVKIYGQNVAGSPAFGQENGRIYQLAQTGTTTVSELPMAGYSATFSGDCNSNGEVYMEFGGKKTCTITNNDIALVPPLINVTKVPTPLALPGGAGSVTYDYLVTNLGTVGMLNVKVTDDKCANVTYVSGDLNSNSRLGINETWRYTCTTTLSQTTTNTVTATGQANGFTATDVASATVVVGSPVVPPLIHIVKIPNKFLLPATGGAVTYNYFVTNIGTVPLSNVTVTDDKCTGLPGRVLGHPGDLNKNNLLESTEIWTFTCQTNLTKTTTNIGTATGEANGFTAVDLSPATVVVASPALPNTGFGLDTRGIIAMLAGIIAASALFYFVRRKQTN